MRGAPRVALLTGLLVSFVIVVNLIRAVRLPLLLDSDPLWSLPRLILGLGVLAAAASAGGAAAGAFFLWSRGRFIRAELQDLPFSRRSLAALALVAILAGASLRFALLDRVPSALWVDDVSLVGPTLALEGTWRDFADSIRPAPFGAKKPYGTVGVLYLEVQRQALRLLGTSVLGVRFLAALAGAISVVTAMLLGRALLPRGGGALAALILSGLRWHLILTRWGWNALVLVPVVDAAALLILRSRRRKSAAAAGIAGLVMGLGAHVYLSAWAAGVALLVLALWRSEALSAARLRIRLAGLYVLGFAIAAAPLFILRENRTFSYFARTSDHNVLIEMRRTRSFLPPFAAAADSLAAPWFVPDPVPLNDLPGKSRLGWVLGIPVAAALARCLVFRSEELSGFLLAHAGTAFAASLTGGQAGLPNGYRFAYLTTITAVAAAAGTVWLIAWVPARLRHITALAAVGLLAVNGARGARDAIVVWGEGQSTFDYFHGPDTLLARAAIRWERYGAVTPDLSLLHSPITFEAVRRYRLDPEERLSVRRRPAGGGRVREFRIVAPDSAPGPEERAVERVRDGWGRDWGVVFGRATPKP